MASLGSLCAKRLAASRGNIFHNFKPIFVFCFSCLLNRETLRPLTMMLMFFGPFFEQFKTGITSFIKSPVKFAYPVMKFATEPPKDPPGPPPKETRRELSILLLLLLLLSETYVFSYTIISMALSFFVFYSGCSED